MSEQRTGPASAKRKILFREAPRVVAREIRDGGLIAQPDPSAGACCPMVELGILVMGEGFVIATGAKKELPIEGGMMAVVHETRGAPATVRRAAIAEPAVLRRRHRSLETRQSDRPHWHDDRCRIVRLQIPQAGAEKIDGIERVSVGSDQNAGTWRCDGRDEVDRGGLKPPWIVDQSDRGMLVRHFGDDFARAIGAAAVGHEDLDFSRFNLGQDGVKASRDEPFLIEHRDDDGGQSRLGSFSFPRMKDMRFRAMRPGAFEDRRR